jgi:hypothetical protein
MEHRLKHGSSKVSVSSVFHPWLPKLVSCVKRPAELANGEPALRPKPYRTDSALQRGQFGKPPQIEINSVYTLDSEITVVPQDECTGWS